MIDYLPDAGLIQNGRQRRLSELFFLACYHTFLMRQAHLLKIFGLTLAGTG